MIPNIHQNVDKLNNHIIHDAKIKTYFLDRNEFCLLRNITIKLHSTERRSQIQE